MFFFLLFVVVVVVVGGGGGGGLRALRAYIEAGVYSLELMLRRKAENVHVPKKTTGHSITASRAT